MRRGDRGSIAPMIPILMFALLILGGLVVDGSRTLNARGDARAFAEEAARAGATAIDPGAEQKVDPGEAEQRVKDYCTAVAMNTHDNQRIACKFVSLTQDKVCDGSEQYVVVNTEATVQTDTTLLGMVGFTKFTMSADASARPFEQTFDPRKPYC